MRVFVSKNLLLWIIVNPIVCVFAEKQIIVLYPRLSICSALSYDTINSRLETQIYLQILSRLIRGGTPTPSRPHMNSGVFDVTIGILLIIGRRAQLPVMYSAINKTQRRATVYSRVNSVYMTLFESNFCNHLLNSNHYIQDLLGVMY